MCSTIPEKIIACQVREGRRGSVAIEVWKRAGYMGEMHRSLSPSPPFLKRSVMLTISRLLPVVNTLDRSVDSCYADTVVATPL